MESSKGVCLGIPILQSILSLLPHREKKSEAFANPIVREVIQDFGHQHRKSAEEIEKACRLADGFDDLVILLERPASDHNYVDPFESFVRDSPVLHGVNEVVSFVTHGSRSIHDTCVLDAFLFRPRNVGDGPTENECHDIIHKLLCIKRPDVVLACCTTILMEHRLARFQGSDIESAPFLATRHIEQKPVISVRCFHPGYCINRVPYEPRSRVALILAFCLAFARSASERDALMSIAKAVRPRFQQ